MSSALQISESAIKSVLETLQIPSLSEHFALYIQHIDLSSQPKQVAFTFPFPYEGLAAESQALVQETLSQHFSDKEWQITIRSKIQPHKAANAIKPFNGIKNIIAIASGKGGVGKSSTSVNLALALKGLGAKVGLLDADIYGPNLALMLGVPEGTRPEVEAQKYMIPLRAQGIQSMSMSYVTTEETPIVWRGPKASGAFSQLLSTTL